MITDSLINLGKYKNLVPFLDEIENFLKNKDISSFSGGKYEIVKDSVFILIQEYLTQARSEKFRESHKKYIDIQIVLEGREYMGYSPVSFLKIKDPYNQENDVMFYENDSTDNSCLLVHKNYFCVFFPEDAHKPGLHISEVRKVKKAVIKVSVNGK